MDAAKDFDAFALAMAKSESSDDYACVNKWGFLGRYQFGRPRLTDLGVCERAAHGYEFIPPLSEEKFLADHALQDKLFREHVRELRNEIDRQFRDHIGLEVNGAEVTMSGCVAVCHLLGLGGLHEFLDGYDGVDALGTSASKYMKKFAGYDLSAA